jgi:lipoprotein-anchoring transpeptidase ErfK/SrfK
MNAGTSPQPGSAAHAAPGRRRALLETIAMKHRTRSAVVAALLALTLGLAAAGCAGSSAQHDRAEAPAPMTEAAAPEPAHSASLRLDGATEARVAPNPGAAVITTLPARTELGSVTTLLVLDARDGWLQVVLPIRPNGTTGWVRADAGTLRTTSYRIDVDLATRTLTLFDDAEVVIRSAVAIGAADTPTPTGVFSVTDLVDTGDPDGDYGPSAVGVSGHSDELTEFAGGDGQIGIHGTNRPTSIGQAVSHGCIRLPNELVAQLVTVVPLGTPVTIR